MSATPIRVLAFGILANGPIIGLDIAAACDIGTPAQPHPALAAMLLAGLNFAAGVGWARSTFIPPAEPEPREAEP